MLPKVVVMPSKHREFLLPSPPPHLRPPQSPVPNRSTINGRLSFDLKEMSTMELITSAPQRGITYLKDSVNYYAEHKQILYVSCFPDETG